MLTRLTGGGAGALSHRGGEVSLMGAAIAGAVVPLAGGLCSCIFNSWLLGPCLLMKEMLRSAPTLLGVSGTLVVYPSCQRLLASGVVVPLKGVLGLQPGVTRFGSGPGSQDG